jgi:hypothetical protein
MLAIRAMYPDSRNKINQAKHLSRARFENGISWGQEEAGDFESDVD